MSLDLQTLIDKLNPVCRRALEKAAELCVSQTHYNVEIEHYLLALVEPLDTDVQRLFRLHDVRIEEVNRDLTRAIEGMKRGNNRTPALAPQIIQLMEQAWLQSSLCFQASCVRSAAIVLALLDDDSLRGLILRSAPSLKRIPRASLKHDLLEIARHTRESAGEPAGEFESAAPTGPRSGASPRVDNDAPGSHSAAPPATPALDQYTIDLTERARQGLIDPIQERDGEIRQIIDILTRRRQNNPILTGDAGVGKTAVVEGLAIRVANGDVPPPLKNISLRLLDLGLLQAGAGIKGEFEKRLKTVIDEVKSSPNPVILFIDEAHTMIGAGAPAGMGDAANMLKPAWPGGNCGPSRPPLGPNTRNISRRIRP